MSVILVVDSLAASRAQLGQLLVGAGYTVEQAVNGVEAMEMLLSMPISMIFSDVNLPKMDGLLLVRQVRQQPMVRGVPMVLMSAAPRPGEREAAMRAGANLYRNKPLAPEDAVGLARLLVRSSPGGLLQGKYY